MRNGLGVAVVSPSEAVRNDLAARTGELPGLTVRHQLSSVAQLVAPPTGPPLAVVDVSGLRSAALGTRFWSMLPLRTRVVLICRPAEPPSLPVAIQAGVRAMIRPDFARPDLRLAFDAATLDNVYVCPGLADAMTGGTRAQDVPLSGRETEAVLLVADGLTTPMIGVRMGVTEATAETYLKRARTKLNAANKAELTARARELGLLERQAEPPRVIQNKVTSGTISGRPWR